MIADWDTNTVFFTASLARRFPRFWQELQAILTANRIPVRLLKRARDIWARDFMPVQVSEDQFVKFRYEPDYLVSREHERTGPEICKQVDFLDGTQISQICLDGGNVVGSSNRAILTDKVFSENPEWRRPGLRKELCKSLQVEECIFIPPDPADEFGHADGVVRFIDDQTVVMSDYSSIDARYGDRVRKALDGHSLTVHLLPCFADITDGDDGLSAVGNYVNFLRLGGLTICPAYGAGEDNAALKTMQRLLPCATLVSLDCTEIAKDGGVLNCISWTCRIKLEASPGQHWRPAVAPRKHGR